MGRRKEKRSRGLHLTRGLRTHRYHCIALRAFWEKEKKKEISDCVFIFSRGLRTHRYHCVALRAFFAEGRELRAESISTLSTLSNFQTFLHSCLFRKDNVFFARNGITYFGLISAVPDKVD